MGLRAPIPKDRRSTDTTKRDKTAGLCGTVDRNGEEVDKIRCKDLCHQLQHYLHNQGETCQLPNLINKTSLEVVAYYVLNL